jgi:hypothetical protein
MKSLIKKTFAAVVILAAIVDWPVKVEAGCGQVVAKEAVPLLRGCAGKVGGKVGKVTVNTEKLVNRSTQMMERCGNKTLQNKNVQNGALRASMRANFIKCPRCHGKGSVQGYNGYVYTCARCNGLGIIRVVR